MSDVVVIVILAAAICLLFVAAFIAECVIKRRAIDIPPPGWNDDALRKYGDRVTPGDKPWPHNQYCVRKGRCLIDHSPCNGFPRLAELEPFEVN